MTCNHVVSDADQVEILISTGETLQGAIVDQDPEHDLALLRVQWEPPAVVPVLLAQSAALGDEVNTLGFPVPELEGFNPKLTSGIINSLTGPADDPDYLHISAAVQPGAVIAEQGYLLGIVSGRIKEGVFLRETDVLPQNVNYARKTSLARTLLANQEVALETTVFQTKKEAIQNLEKATVLILVYRFPERSPRTTAEPVRKPNSFRWSGKIWKETSNEGLSSDFHLHRFRKKDYAVPRLGGLACAHDAPEVKLEDRTSAPMNASDVREESRSSAPG